MAKSKKSKMLSFNWKIFSMKAIKLLEFSSQSSIVPVKDIRWEEIVFHVLKNMGQKYKGGDPKWDMGSHAKGADIWTDEFAISAKAGNIKTDFISISSYRLTRFKNLQEMKVFIDGTGKNFNFYLCCVSTDNSDGSRTYKIFCVPSTVFNAKKLKWSRKRSRHGGVVSGWQGSNKQGVEVQIIKNMSNQLWIKVPLKLCSKIGEVKIQRNFLGVALDKILHKK